MSSKELFNEAIKQIVTTCNRHIPVPGDVYTHFKGDKMLVESVGLDSDSLSPVIVYRHINDDVIWVRPLVEFLSVVDREKYPDVKQKYRFEREVPMAVMETKGYQELYQIFSEHSDIVGDIDAYIMEHFYI